VPTNIRATGTWLSFGLAFVGGYGDAASFVLAKTFTGHVIGNLVLGAIAVAARDWRATLGHFAASITFFGRKSPEYSYCASSQEVAILLGRAGALPHVAPTFRCCGSFLLVRAKLEAVFDLAFR
jgi:uncharacterized membrane protein YoaK (UPF0700 family)